jgi:four helix bundle protein
LSVQLNIAEGYTYGDSPSYTRHLAIAFGSAVETIEILELLTEGGIIEGDLVSEVLRRARLSRKLLTGMLKRRRKFQNNRELRTGN